MNQKLKWLGMLSLAVAMSLASRAMAADTPGKPLLELVTGAAQQFKSPSDEIKVTDGTAAEPGVVITIQTGKDDYPGVDLKPAEGVWDLSAYGHVDARITNLGNKPVSVSMRLDNNGNWKDSPWNTESTSIKPGETGTVKVIFGYAYGQKPGYKLNPSAIANLKIFTGKSKVETSLRLVSLIAGGEPGEKPAVDPNSIRIKPVNGAIVGEGAKLDQAKQLNVHFAKASVEGSGVKAVLDDKKTDAAVKITPGVGRWDLREYLQVQVKVKNAGTAALTPKVRVDSNSGNSDWVSADAIAPGAVAELTVPFGGKVWDGSVKGSGNTVSSNTVSAITFSAEGEGQRTLEIVSVKAVYPPAPTMPEWLGQKPPVEGEWAKTFEDNFDGDAIDYAKWNIYSPNYWDKRSHFTKDNLIVGDGVVKIRYTKTHGHHNDDPAAKETDYAVGFLDSYGKWTQRYGYFEARVKLPKAPGLWPAFWFMPDHGVEAGPQWKRSDTRNGGMEFDVLEHLTGWGQLRYNIAMHYDGYEKEHKATGTDRAYVQPDKDGFITPGLLWTPGSLIYYCNGVVVAKWENERVSAVPAFPIINMVSGGWDNTPIDDAQFPADYVVDYFRAWQRKDLASPVDGMKGAPAVPGKPKD